jgi:predicted patatin/cPLA2 family phospholipase
MTNTGLILEGGGMRGSYTAGVLDYFLDAGLCFHSVYGVSAGACHACSYLSGQKGRALHTITDYVDDWHYAGFRSLLTTGDFFGVKMIYDDVPNRLLPYDYDALEKRGADFTVVMTDVETGKPVYVKVTDLRKDIVVIQASSSLPLLSRVVRIDGRQYLDGGIADSIPLAKSIADGHKKNVVVLTRHKGYQKEPDSLLSLMRVRYRHYPALVASLETRHRQYNEALALCYSEEAAGNAVIIQPKTPVAISRLEKDPEKLRALYREGYEDAEAAMITVK